jgi:DMSO/TMAO reductase YedYZ molybdopterin-dependent catalytic subunit
MRILLALLLWLTPAVAQEKAPEAASTAVRLQGALNMPVTYSMAQLAGLPSAGLPSAGLPSAGLPSVSVTLSIEGHGDVSGVWKGVPLLALIQKAGLSGQGSGLGHVIIARGTDNYTVAIAMGEIDSRFEGKSVIVAYQKDGQPISSLRLIVPGDSHAGRDVRDLAELTVR